MKFSLRISSINVTKSEGNCGFVHIYWRNPLWKTSFFVQWRMIEEQEKKHIKGLERHRKQLVKSSSEKESWKHLKQKTIFEKHANKKTDTKCK